MLPLASLMTFLDDLKLAGLQSFKNALNDPTFRRNLQPNPNIPTPTPGLARGWSNTLNNAADFYSNEAQKAINGILGLGSPDGPVPLNPLPSRCPTQYKVIGSLRYYANSTTTDVYTANINIGTRYGPLEEVFIKPTRNGASQLQLRHRDRFGNPDDSQLFPFGRGARLISYNLDGTYRVDGGSDNCGKPNAFGDPYGGPPSGANPDNPVNPGGNHPGSMRFGKPYLDNEGNLRVPFNVGGDGWRLGGSFDPATGEWDFGPPLPVDANGNPIGDPNRNGKEPDAPGDGDDCVKEVICGTDEWPVTVPSLLTNSESDDLEIATLPQAIAWFVKNIDAITGQYPIKIEIADADPLTDGAQPQLISLPNQSEALAEMFGLAYESNLNSELAVNMLFRMIPELIATKNSSLTTQDYTQAITNYLGFRTKNVSRKVNSNFNPLRADTLGEFLKESTYRLPGVEDDDPHTLVEWLTQIKYGVAIGKASVFRSPDQAENLVEEMKSVIESKPGDSGEEWERFIDALNRSASNLTDRDYHPRPRATSVEDILNPLTQLPERGE